MISLDSFASQGSASTTSFLTDDIPPHFDPGIPAAIASNAFSKVLASVAPPSEFRQSNWLMSLAYFLGRRVVLPGYFQTIDVVGQDQLPQSGPVILAPTHRSRWDPLLVPYAAGRDITGRDLRFMVSADEVKGIQGWFIQRLGGFAVNVRRPTVASLRKGIDTLLKRETLVIFPEGGDLCDNRLYNINKLHPGLARLALQAEAAQPGLGIQVVPISIDYAQSHVPWRSRVQIRIGKPLCVSNYSTETPKQSARELTDDLQKALRHLGMAASMEAGS